MALAEIPTESPLQLRKQPVFLLAARQAVVGIEGEFRIGMIANPVIHHCRVLAIEGPDLLRVEITVTGVKGLLLIPVLVTHVGLFCT